MNSDLGRGRLGSQSFCPDWSVLASKHPKLIVSALVLSLYRPLILIIYVSLTCIWCLQGMFIVFLMLYLAYIEYIH